MPLNGSGTYAAPASTWNPAVTNTTINSTDWTALLADITTALSTAMYKDGQSTPTNNLTMGGFKITNLAPGTLVSDAVRVSQVQNASFTSLTAVAGTNTITATVTPTPAAYVVGQVFEGIAANNNTGATTLNISSLGAGAVQVAGAALVGGELAANAPFRVIVSAITPVFQLESSAPFVDSAPLIKGSSDATKKARFEVDGNTTGVTRVGTVPDSDFSLGMPRSYLAGLTMSTAGSSATMSVAAGAARDSTNAADLNLAASISKTTSAWTVGTGNGGIDTGAVANGTWYHFYLIMRPDTGVVDALFSLSASAPTMPANYSYKRRIGSGKTDGSAQWIAFIQDGDYFRLSASVTEFGDTNPGTTGQTKTLAAVPTGVNVQAFTSWEGNTTGGNILLYVSDLAAADEAPSSSAAPLATLFIENSALAGSCSTLVRTNTSAQVRYRISFSDASTQIRAATLGWYDSRGRNS